MFNHEFLKDPSGTVPRASLLLNWQQPVTRIDGILDVAEEKWKNRCFVHWFNKYGVDDMAFDSALACAREVVDSYHSVDM